MDSRRELRGIDPQSVMLADVAQSDIALSISIPQVFGDLTAGELSTLNQMVGCLIPSSDRPFSEKTTEGNDPNARKRLAVLAVSITFDFVSLEPYMAR